MTFWRRACLSSMYNPSSRIRAAVRRGSDDLIPESHYLSVVVFNPSSQDADRVLVD